MPIRCRIHQKRTTVVDAISAALHKHSYAHWFTTLRQARTIIESWRMDYNGVRPQSALGYATHRTIDDQALKVCQLFEEPTELEVAFGTRRSCPSSAEVVK